MRRGLAALACLAVACGRMHPPEGDVVPPTVVRFDPAGEDVQPDAAVTVTFSEPMDPEAAWSDLVVVAPDEQVDAAFLQDHDKPPLAKSRSAIPVPCRIRTEAGDYVLVLEPRDALLGGQVYAVVVSAAVRDRAGNPIVTDTRLDEHGRVVGEQTHLIHRFTVRGEPGDPEPGTGIPDGGTEMERDPDAFPIDLVFTEILANPSGTESHGEYVEVLNLGTSAADLAGFRLDDRGGLGTGDLLQPCREEDGAGLPPGGFALLVGQAFLPPPDLLPGTTLVCTDGPTLTSRGLKNTGGEVLVLVDPAGAEVTRYGGWLDMSSSEGCAATRLDPRAPDAPENWVLPEVEPCRSPGWLD